MESSLGDTPLSAFGISLFSSSKAQAWADYVELPPRDFSQSSLADLTSLGTTLPWTDTSGNDLYSLRQAMIGVRRLGNINNLLSPDENNSLLAASVNVYSQLQVRGLDLPGIGNESASFGMDQDLLAYGFVSMGFSGGGELPSSMLSGRGGLMAILPTQARFVPLRTIDVPDTFDLEEISIPGFDAPQISMDRHGFLTNGTFTLDAAGLAKHLDGTPGKSQYFFRADAAQLTLDAAAYADSLGLFNNSEGVFVGGKATVYFAQPIGVHGASGLPTSKLNLYSNGNGHVHSSPGSPGS